MKTTILATIAGLVLLVAPAFAEVSLGFDPEYQEVKPGTFCEVDLVIKGLGHKHEPSLGLLDVSVRYDPKVVSFSKADYGDPELGDQLALFAPSVKLTTSKQGRVNLFELSTDLPKDLNDHQVGGFTLGTLTFDYYEGCTGLKLDVEALGDAFGLGIKEFTTGSATICPEPTSLALLALGGPALLRRRGRLGC